jgi:hypothetical protein
MWQPCLGIEYASSQWYDSTYTQEGFFLFGGCVKVECYILMFPCCSPWCSPSFQCVPQECSQYISPYLISFAPKFSLFSYISEPKGDTPSSHKTCYFWEPPKFQFFWVMDNMTWPVVKGKFRKRTLVAAHLIPVMSDWNWIWGIFLNPLYGHESFQRQFQK